MDREIPIANRYLYNKLQKIERKRHLKRLQQIRNKTPTNPAHSYTRSQQFHTRNRQNSAFIENRNLQIQKSNILLFNRQQITFKKVSQKQFGKDQKQHLKIFIHTSTDKISNQTSRKVYSLKNQNQQLEKRINSQQPTIKNKIFYKDRRKNQKYLSFIGRYPYNPIKKNYTQSDVQIDITQINQQTTQSQIFQIEGDQYNIKIVKDSPNCYIFRVDDGNGNQYKLQMTAYQFRRQLQRCQNYKQLIKNLRLKNNLMIYDYDHQ